MTRKHDMTPGSGRASARWAALSLLLALAPLAVQADCTVSASGVSFGSYDVFSPSPNDSAGNVSVSCDPVTAYSITLSTGGGTYSQRTMSGGGESLHYNLYTSASRSVVWGDGSGVTATVGGSGPGDNHAVYGRVPAGQNVPAGSYSDSIVVTVSF